MTEIGSGIILYPHLLSKNVTNLSSNHESGLKLLSACAKLLISYGNDEVYYVIILCCKLENSKSNRIAVLSQHLHTRCSNAII